MIYTQKKYRINSLYIILLILFTSSVSSYAQTKIKTYKFKGTTWASSCADSIFFKADTVNLIKIVDTKSSDINYPMNLAAYFNNNDFITLKFSKANCLKLSLTIVDTWSIVETKEQYKWVFDPKNRILKLYSKEKVLASFKLLSEKKIKIKSSHVDHSPITTIEVAMKRIRN